MAAGANGQQLRSADRELLADYPRFYAVCGALIAVVAIGWGLFPQSPRLQSIPIYLIAGLTGLFALGWYRWITGRPITETHLIVASAVYLTFVVLLVFFGGDLNSPFIFLTLPALLLAGITLGAGPTLLLALGTVVGLLGVSLIGPSGALSVTPVWSTAIVSLVVVAGLSGFLGHDLRQRYRAMEEARAQADRFSIIDSLTGLYNRRQLDTLLPQEIARTRRNGRPFAILMMDSDHLKMVNDTYGHHAGDQLIIEMGRVIGEQIRLIDTAIRFGGDEFVVILPDTDLAGALNVADRIRTAVAKRPVDVRGKSIPTTVSMGVAAFPETAEKFDELLDRADQALYASKHAGRNCVTAYSPAVAEVPSGKD